MAPVLTLLAFVLFVGVIRSQVALMMVAILLMGASVVFAVWSRHAVSALTYHRSFDPPRIFPGEETELVVEITNRSWLPLPWLRVFERFPGPVVPVRQPGESESTRPGAGRVRAESWHRRRSLSLAWHERLVIRERMTCVRRGQYTFGPTDLETGDPTGLFSENLRVPETRELIVYPQLAAIPDILTESRVPFGSRKASPPTLEDPAQFAGIRDYRPGDPRRWVDWKASARRMQLQTRVFTPTTLNTMVVALNVQTMDYAWQGYDAERFEQVVSVAASVIDQLVNIGNPVGLAVNGSGVDTEDFQVFLPPNRRPDQLEDALGLLAQLSPLPTLAFGTFLRRVVSSFPYWTGMIVVTGYLDPATAEDIEALSHWGHRISMVYVGSDLTADVGPRIPVIHIDDPRDAVSPPAIAGDRDAVSPRALAGDRDGTTPASEDLVHA
jgi:uncharacterized protein (DUF58 family)